MRRLWWSPGEVDDRLKKTRQPGASYVSWEEARSCLVFVLKSLSHIFSVCFLQESRDEITA